MIKTKDSGCYYIGLIPLHWKISKYKFHAISRMGETLLASDTAKDKDETHIIPVYSATQDSSIFGYVSNSKNLLRKGDIVIPARGNSIGFATFVCENNATCTQTTICSKNINNIINKYLYYCCYAFKIEWYKYDGSAIPQITVEQVNNNILPYPSLEEQKKIADYLDNKCSQIDSLKSDIQQQISILEQYKKSLITEVVTKGLDPNAEMKDSGVNWIGKMPKKWITMKLKYIHSRSNVGEGIDKTYWSMNDEDNVFYTAGIDPIRTNYSNFPKWKYVKVNDLLLSRNGTPYVYLPKFQSVYSDHIIRITIKNGFDKRFVRYCLQRAIESVDVDVVSIATWSVSIWNKQYLPIPSLETQILIADYLDNKCSQIEDILTEKRKQIEVLDEYKKSLIYEYVTGKKEVK